jgi:hypothetical protein
VANGWSDTLTPAAPASSSRDQVMDRHPAAVATKRVMSTKTCIGPSG